MLQITTGCSANLCTFCGAYKGKPFRIKNEAEIYSDIETGANWNPTGRRVFLMDGDALAIDNSVDLYRFGKRESANSGSL